MALSFPSNPTTGQTYSSGSSATYRYTGVYWALVTPPTNTTLNSLTSSFATSASLALRVERGEAIVTVSSSVPTQTLPSGSLWWNSNNGNLYIQATSPTGSTYAPAVNNVINSLSASYAETASYAPGAGKRSIDKISQTGYGGVLILSEGKLFSLKGSDGIYGCYHGALAPNSVQTGLNRGAINAYEIEFPAETGSIIDADTYGEQAYALFDNGDLYTWGRNSSGQCGVSSTSIIYYPVLSNTNVTNVYVHRSNGSNLPNETRLLIKKTDGKIYACGRNQDYELGIGNNTNQTSWVELTWAGTNPLSVWNLGATAGAIFVQKSDTQIWVAGNNAQGQLGIGSTTTPTSAVQAANWLGGDSTNRIVEICMGNRSSGDNDSNITLLLSNGSVTTILSAGYNGTGAVGNASTTNVNTPTTPNIGLGPYSDVTSIASVGGSRRTTYMIQSSTNQLKSWGYANNGQGGWGSTLTITSPILINLGGTGTTNAKRIIPIAQGFITSNSTLTTSALVESLNGNYYMSGYNAAGQLGAGIAGSTSNTFVQVRLPQGTNIKFVGMTSTNNEGITYYAVDTENNIWVWGYNGYFTIDPVSSTAYYQPVQIQPTALLK